MLFNRGIIIKLATAGGNKQREWGDIQKKTNGFCLSLLLRSGRKKISGPRWLSVSRPEERSLRWRRTVVDNDLHIWNHVSWSESLEEAGGRHYSWFELVGGRVDTQLY